MNNYQKRELLKLLREYSNDLTQEDDKKSMVLRNKVFDDAKRLALEMLRRKQDKINSLPIISGKYRNLKLPVNNRIHFTITDSSKNPQKGASVKIRPDERENIEMAEKILNYNLNKKIRNVTNYNRNLDNQIFKCAKGAFDSIYWFYNFCYLLIQLQNINLIYSLGDNWNIIFGLFTYKNLTQSTNVIKEVNVNNISEDNINEIDKQIKSKLQYIIQYMIAGYENLNTNYITNMLKLYNILKDNDLEEAYYELIK